MSTFRAFQSGLQAGQEQAKVRRQDDARVKAADAFGKGNYEGATASLMGVGLHDEADAYGKAGERKVEADRTKAYADAFKTGLGAGPKPDTRSGYESVRNAAAQQGDFKSMGEIDKVISGMDENQAKQFKDGMEFLGQTAIGLKGVPPEMRGEAALEILSKTPYANEQVMSLITQAQADGKITDEELDNFAMMTMSVADRVKATKDQGYTLGPGQVRYGPDNTVLASQPPRAPGNGIQLDFGEDGSLSGLSIGGTGTKGKEPAVARGPDGAPVVTPGQQQLVLNKDYQRIKSEGAQTALVREDIKRALGLVNDGTTGGWAATKDLPLVGNSTKSGQLANALATIKANVGFDKLSEMRANSPTGGALGNVTEKELAFLQGVQGSLEQSQTAADLEYNLKRLDDFFAGRDQRRLEAFAQDYPSLAEFVGFKKSTVEQGKSLQGMSKEDLQKRADELRAKAAGKK